MSRVIRGDELWPFLRPWTRHCAAEVARRVSVDLSAPEEAPRRGLGLCVSDDGARPVALALGDARYHTHVVGPTGSGKSWALAGMALDAVEYPRVAVAVVDVKDGLLVEDILARLPRDCWERVRLIAPADGDRAVGLNVLECRDPAMHALVADQVVEVLHQLFSSSWGPRSAHVLRAAALTVLPRGGTLTDVADVLVDREAQDRYTRGLDDLGLESFWSEWAGLTDSERQRQAGPVLYKLRELVLSEPVRTLLGQERSTVDLEEVLDAGGILLVSLPAGRLGRETSQLIGALVVSRLWQAAQGRAGRSDDERPPALLVLDEFQHIVRLGPVDEILTEARSYNVGLALGHQHLAQLPQETAAAVYANCRTRLAFQPGDEAEAKRLQAFFVGTRAEQLLALRRHQVVARVCVDGRSSGTFSGFTRPLPELARLPGEPATWEPEAPEAERIRAEHAAELRRLALERWGRPRAEVERELRDRRRRWPAHHDEYGGTRA